MTDLPPDWFSLWEWAGAAAGTVISITYLRPASRADFIGRVVVSVLFGGAFGFMTGDLLGWPDTARHDFAGGTFMSFFSYAAIGVVFRVLKGIDKWPPGK